MKTMKEMIEETDKKESTRKHARETGEQSMTLKVNTKTGVTQVDMRMDLEVLAKTLGIMFAEVGATEKEMLAFHIMVRDASKMKKGDNYEQ